MLSSKLINLTLLWSVGAMGSTSARKNEDGTSSSSNHHHHHLRKLIQLTDSSNFYETVMAEYHPNYGVPFCRAVGNECSSGELLIGRGNILGGNENNAPNTLDGCPDGDLGTYWADESLEKIVVRAGGINGTGVENRLEAGKVVTIVATVFPYFDGTFNYADFYYSSEGNEEWTFIDTVWPSGGGLQELVAEYVLPSDTEYHAVRVNFRSAPGVGACTTGSWDDRDDLLFTVVSGREEYEPCLVNERVELLLEGTCSYDVLYEAVADKLLERIESCPSSDPVYEIIALLDAENETDSRVIVDEMCKDAILAALTKKSPFEFDRFSGMDHDFNKAFFDGQSSWNDGGMTKKQANKPPKDDDGEASDEWQGNSKAVSDIYERHADRRQMTWPDAYENFQDCQLNAAMCCWVDYDASLGPEFHNNTEICYVDNERAPSSNHINAGFSLYGDIHGHEEAFCHGFAWESDSLDDYFKGNLLFLSEVYDNMHTAGLSNNVPGAPMCGCIEKMPVVSRADCTMLEYHGDFVFEHFPWSNSIFADGAVRIGDGLCGLAIGEFLNDILGNDTIEPSAAPITSSPTSTPITPAPSTAPSVTSSPTSAPITPAPSAAPITSSPTSAPITPSPSAAPVTPSPSAIPPAETLPPTSLASLSAMPTKQSSSTTAPTSAPSYLPTYLPTRIDTLSTSTPTMSSTSTSSTFPTISPTECVESPHVIRKVKISSTTGEMIQVLDLRVIDPNLFNRAAGRPAYQSSDYVLDSSGNVAKASYAVDGTLTTFSSTSSNDNSGWLMVDLEEDTPLRYILIANRNCPQENVSQCLCRLSYASVQILDEHDNVIDEQRLGGMCGQYGTSVLFPKCYDITASPA
eukprot:scaffold88288_cov62-Cyclotella_meneghiniana.AAC.3